MTTFKKGDRVRLKADYKSLKAGDAGTVASVDRTTIGVTFDLSGPSNLKPERFELIRDTAPDADRAVRRSSYMTTDGKITTNDIALGLVKLEGTP